MGLIQRETPAGDHHRFSGQIKEGAFDFRAPIVDANKISGHERSFSLQ
jgi:hypothetical protein